ncbi:DUF2269 domain-containing protein [Piscinibacter sp. XHJ-5]|uniref:DUF2269 family protein n=1 Tax=Piscinibacter sp. XHJ-5 TaxID=3037797 RepID=UPI002452C90C|nr:DUF2269 domain-containing protein [Piscinibacter sp. XHJ-5]
MEHYAIVKWLHIVSSTVLFGTGIGTAFFLLMTTRSKDVRAVASVARTVVLADWIFTATTAVFQPVSGFYLAHVAGMPLGTRWLMWSIVLYAVALACWLPVVRLQQRMRDLAEAAARLEEPLPASYTRVFRTWVALGIPAFLAFVAIFYLMTVKPA